MNEILNALLVCPMLAGKKTYEIEALLSQIHYRTSSYKKGDYVFAPNQPAVNLGIIIQGSIEVQKELASGKTITVTRQDKGAVFGGAILLADQETYNCSVLAQEKSNIMLISKTSFINILCRDQQINSNLLILFSQNVLMLDRKVELLTYSSIQQKIVFSLLSDMEINEDGTIHLPYSKQSWAEHLNVSRPSLCRELKALDKKGIIESKARSIRIINREELETILRN